MQTVYWIDWDAKTITFREVASADEASYALYEMGFFATYGEAVKALALAA